MCNFFSCIVTKKDEIFYSLNSNSHEDLINEHELEDDALANRDFVRIEIKPLDSMFSRIRGNWSIEVDEEETLPTWFEDNQRRIFEKLYDVLDVVFKTLDSSLSDPHTDPETKLRDQKIDGIRDYSYRLYWQEKDKKSPITQRQKEFKEAYDAQFSIEDDLSDEISDWFEDYGLFGFYEDLSENTINVAISIKNKTPRIQDLMNKYIVALEEAYKLVD